MQKILDLLWAAVLTFWPIVSLLLVVHISLSSPNQLIDKERAIEHFFEHEEIRSLSIFPDIETNTDKSEAILEESKKTKKEQPTKNQKSEITKKKSKLEHSDIKNKGNVLKNGTQSRKYRKKKRKCSSHKNANMVERLDSKTYLLSYEHFDYYMSHHKKARNLADLRIISARNSDTFRGIRIKNISCDSPLYHMGLRRGDLVLSVSGTNLSSYSQMWRAYRQAKKASNFSVTIRRGKQIITNQYTPTVM